MTPKYIALRPIATATGWDIECIAETEPEILEYMYPPTTKLFRLTKLEHIANIEVQTTYIAICPHCGTRQKINPKIKYLNCNDCTYVFSLEAH